MTAHKKVKSRRTVFDATFGEKSLNNSTPSDYYMGLPCKYTFPKIQDYKEMILNCGQGEGETHRRVGRIFSGGDIILTLSTLSLCLLHSCFMTHMRYVLETPHQVVQELGMGENTGVGSCLNICLTPRYQSTSRSSGR